ncbi:MAG TPA: PIN domain-containing protein [Polyangia bacterium]
MSRRAFEEAAKMARHPAHGLRSGDALHLAVAREISANTVATLDTTTAGHAKRLKMKTVEFS